MSEYKNKINLDRLLDLKKAEHPSPDFWDGFQKEFRQRQLQALIEKESVWSRIPLFFFARSGVIIPLSAVAAALFILVVNFRGNSPVHNEHFEGVSLIQIPSHSVAKELAAEAPKPEADAEALDIAPELIASANYVVDVIPTNQPDSLSYTQEFPTETIISENRAVSALISYSLARETPQFGLAGDPQTIGF